MLRYIAPNVLTVALIWYFFGGMWGGIALATWAVFALLGMWIKNTDADIERLRGEVRYLREQMERITNHGGMPTGQ